MTERSPARASLEHRVAGATVAVHESGTGVPVLLLHGNPDSSRVWTPLMRDLACAVRCIAPDLPGFGASALNQDVLGDLKRCGQWVEELMDRLCIDACHLVVHDLGAWFGLPAVSMNPRRYLSVAVLSAPAGPRYRWHVYARMWRTPLLGELLMRGLNRERFVNRLTARNPGLTAEQAGAMYQWFKPRTRRAALRLYRSLSPRVIADWSGRCGVHLRSCPSLALWGEEDRFVPPETAHRTGCRRTVVLPRCGHWPQLEATGVLSQALLSLWSERPGQT